MGERPTSRGATGATGASGSSYPDIFPRGGNMSIVAPSLAANWTVFGAATITDVTLPLPGLAISGVGNGGNQLRGGRRARVAETVIEVWSRTTGEVYGYAGGFGVGWFDVATGKSVMCGVGGGNNTILQGGGVGCYANDNSYDGVASAFATGNRAAQVAPGLPFGLRLSIIGASYVAEYSQDGVNWISCGTITLANSLVPIPTHYRLVGEMGNSASTRIHSSIIDHVRVV